MKPSSNGVTSAARGPHPPLSGRDSKRIQSAAAAATPRLGGRSNKHRTYFAILLFLVFAVSAFDVIYVWRALERDLEDFEAVSASPPGKLSPAVGRIGGDDGSGGGDGRSPRSGSISAAYPRSDGGASANFGGIDRDSRVRVAEILSKAGVDVTSDLYPKLPSWTDVVSQYGPDPVVRNLESCAAYRDSVPQKDRLMGVAGLFNTGTNLLGDLLNMNCKIRNRGPGASGHGMRYQVPWGKHNPPGTHRLVNVAKVGGKGVNQTAVLPAVLIKDPYHWIISQCRHRYFTVWEHDSEHCPNVVSFNSGKPTSVRVKYALEKIEYDTLVEMWNEWNGEWMEQASKYPAVYVRFEDLLFHTERVVDNLCHCVGGERLMNGKKERPFKYMEESAKSRGVHAGANGLISAVIRYGSTEKRLEGWREIEWEYARDHVDTALMDMFNYSRPPRPALLSSVHS